MKSILPYAFVLFALACNHTEKAEEGGEIGVEEPIQGETPDTSIMAIENKPESPIDVELYSKSYSYCWVAGNDTLDFQLRVGQYLSDSTVHVHIMHNEPMSFSMVLDHLNASWQIMGQDFDLNKLNSLYFKPPILYKDLTNKLTASYQKQYGKKRIAYGELDDFLKKSWLEVQVSSLIKPLDLRVERYDIEKFHLMDRAGYSSYIKNADLTGYPKFSLHGMGIFITLQKVK